MSTLLTNALTSRASFVVQSGLQILFGRLYNEPSYGGVNFDVVMTESHNYTERVSSYPIQSGSTIIDNMIKTPTKVSMKAIVSDTPYRLFENVIETVGRVRDVVTSGSVGLRSITALDALVRLQETRQPFTLVTGIKVYPNMVLTGLSVPRDNRTGQMLFFNLEFQEVMLASVQLSAQLFAESTIRNASAYPALNGSPDLSLKNRFSRLAPFGTVALSAINPFKNGAVTSMIRSFGRFLF